MQSWEPSAIYVFLKIKYRNPYNLNVKHGNGMASFSFGRPSQI